MKELASSLFRVVVLGCIVACVLLVGCGRGRPRMFEYDSDVEKINGKINLETTTSVAPRIRVGPYDGPLTRKSIAAVMTDLESGVYASFRVRAYIVFDEHDVTFYRSELFDDDRRLPTANDLASIRKGLVGVLKLYEGI